MHNLEQAIAAWRQTMPTAPHLGPETLDELESHLRETVDQLVHSGMGEAEAFHRTVTELGSASVIASEFQKLKQPAWLPAKVVVGIGVAGALPLAVFLLAHLHEGALGVLLAAHVFTVTLGYTMTLLLGGLGVCFISQRCFSEFPPRRLQSLSQVCSSLAGVAAGFTAVGIVLGMVWSQREWGRFWGWDPKEIGALSVMVWLICFLIVHRSRRVTARGLLILSVLGSNIVSLGWLGPNLLAVGVHSYGIADFSRPLLMIVISNLLFFFIGLAPAGWLRLRKA